MSPVAIALLVTAVLGAAAGCGKDEQPAPPPGTAKVVQTLPPVGTAPLGTTPGTAAEVPATEAPTSTPESSSSSSSSSASTTVPPSRTFTNVPNGARVDVVASGIAVPWGLTFTPDGRAWVNQRSSGTLTAIDPDGTVRDVMTFPVLAQGESGLLGLLASPTYATDGLLYAYFTSTADNRVVRFHPGDQNLQTVISGIPHNVIHDGGRLAFGPDGKLYIATGDAGSEGNAQDLGSLGGKILRLNPDGTVPADNPFAGSPVWSYGHRNVQGMAWDDQGRMYATEFGPDQDDELNRIEPGHNYGWPDVTGNSGGKFTDPLLVLQPDEASPSGLTFVTAPGAWRGNLLFGALRGTRVWRIVLDAAGTVRASEPIFVGTFGRVRTIQQAPDGGIWLTSNNTDGRGQPRPGDDLVVRITPPG